MNCEIPKTLYDALQSFGGSGRCHHKGHQEIIRNNLQPCVVLRFPGILESRGGGHSGSVNLGACSGPHRGRGSGLDL